jgi:NAD(P)-dependent dehydrogenase (short-subunit alcohol dehydrogenase family)
MRDVIITGASRGIGRALALALANRPLPSTRLVLAARNEMKLDDVAHQVEASGTSVLCIPGDLATLVGARTLGDHLAGVIRPASTLVHNAGIWPARRELTSDGLEAAFVVNCVGPLLLQQVLLDHQLLDRIMVVSAGLIVKGRYSAEQTPTGADFSIWRTYCTTKLAFAVAERDLATQHPEVDFVVLHPGVARTDLGARRGLLGILLRWVKRTWEKPEVCACRLRSLLEHDRWSPPGESLWLVEDQERPWPDVTEDAQTKRAVHDTTTRFLTLAKGGP